MWFIDDILDGIFNFALGGMIDICFDKNTAMPVRVLTGIILIAAYIALIGLTMWGCYKLVSDGETGFAVLLECWLLFTSPLLLLRASKESRRRFDNLALECLEIQISDF